MTEMTTYEVAITRMAHGGMGIGHAADRTIFVDAAYPGDTVVVETYKEKKRIAFARVREVLQPSPLRAAPRCPAAAAGAGCCDFATVAPESELDLKVEVLADQLYRLAGMADLPPTRSHELGAPTGWRTRVRMHIDAAGAVGFRRAHGHDIVADQPCAQVHPELMREMQAAPSKWSLTGGAELVGVLDQAGAVHIAEVAKPARGRRSEQVIRVLQGTNEVLHRVADVEFSLPVTAFWQAHEQAVTCFSSLIQENLVAQQLADQAVVWDLYGGCGAFVPAIAQAVGQAHIIEIDHSRDAIRTGLQAFGRHAAATQAQQCTEVAVGQGIAQLDFYAQPVAELIPQLPQPDAVLLDPPRTGAGAQVIQDIARARPTIVMHFGCDAATFARDVASWHEVGYILEQLDVCNAFPGTHHFETIGVLRRSSQSE